MQKHDGCFFFFPSLVLLQTPNLSTKCILGLALPGSVGVMAVFLLCLWFLLTMSAVSSSPIVTAQKSAVVT